MTGPLEGGDVWGPGRAPHGASPPSSGPTSLPGPLEPEATYQRQAEEDVVRREMRDLAEQTIDGTLPYEETWYTNTANVIDLLALLAVAERERDQARQALRGMLELDNLRRRGLDVNKKWESAILSDAAALAEEPQT